MSWAQFSSMYADLQAGKGTPVKPKSTISQITSSIPSAFKYTMPITSVIAGATSIAQRTPAVIRNIPAGSVSKALAYSTPWSAFGSTVLTGGQKSVAVVKETAENIGVKITDLPLYPFPTQIMPHIAPRLPNIPKIPDFPDIKLPDFPDIKLPDFPKYEPPNYLGPFADLFGRLIGAGLNIGAEVGKEPEAVKSNVNLLMLGLLGYAVYKDGL